MQVESSISHIVMKPGDKITVNVGITYKCDIKVTREGRLNILYRGEVLEI